MEEADKPRRGSGRRASLSASCSIVARCRLISARTTSAPPPSLLRAREEREGGGREGGSGGRGRGKRGAGMRNRNPLCAGVRITRIASVTVRVRVEAVDLVRARCVPHSVVGWSPRRQRNAEMLLQLCVTAAWNMESRRRRRDSETARVHAVEGNAGTPRTIRIAILFGALEVIFAFCVRYVRYRIRYIEALIQMRFL